MYVNLSFVCLQENSTGRLQNCIYLTSIQLHWDLNLWLKCPHSYVTESTCTEGKEENEHLCFCICECFVQSTPTLQWLMIGNLWKYGCEISFPIERISFEVLTTGLVKWKQIEGENVQIENCWLSAFLIHKRPAWIYVFRHYKHLLSLQHWLSW